MSITPPNENSPHERDSGNLFERTWTVPRHAYVVPGILAMVLVIQWAFTPQAVSNDMALSRAALALGRYHTIWLYMFAHGGLLHVVLNAFALIAIGGPLVARLGAAPVSWARYLYLFLGSGLAGAALFLALNHSSAMIGASGSIFGTFGALARVHPTSGHLVPVRSRRTWTLARTFVREHAVMFGLVTAATLLGSSFAGIAWEAHLGGLLFGIFASSYFLERPPSAKPAAVGGASHTAD